MNLIMVHTFEEVIQKLVQEVSFYTSLWWSCRVLTCTVWYIGHIVITIVSRFDGVVHARGGGDETGREGRVGWSSVVQQRAECQV